MRWAVVMAGAAALAACGDVEENQTAADMRAAAAGFTPPAVTSRVDWGGRMERRFNELDRDADDRITQAELPRANSRVRRYDADGDGAITREEFNEGAMARFDRMDLNKDGTVTSEEQETSGNGTMPAA